MSLKNAISALETSIETCEAVESKLKRVIRRKRRAGRKISKENRERARAAAKLTHFENVLLEYEASRPVVSAPTQAEIRAVATWLKKVRDLAVKDAAKTAGFNLLKTAVAKSGSLASKVS